MIPPAERRALHTAAAGIVPRTDDVLGHRIAAVERYDDALAAEIDAWASYLHEVSLHRMSARYLRAAAWLSSNPRDRERRWLELTLENLLAQDTSVIRAVYQKVEDAEDVMRRDLVLGALRHLRGRQPRGGVLVPQAAQRRRDHLHRRPPHPLPGRGAARLVPDPGWRGDVADRGRPGTGPGQPRNGPRRPGLAGGGRGVGRQAHPARARPPRPAVRAAREPRRRPWEARNRLGWRADLRADSGLMGPAILDLEHVVSMVDEGGLEAALPPPRPARPVPLVRRPVEQGAPAPAPSPSTWARASHPSRPPSCRCSSIGDGELEEADRKIARAREILTRTRGWRPATGSTSRWSPAEHAADGDDEPRGAVYDGLRETVARAPRGRAREERAVARAAQPGRDLGRGVRRRRRVPGPADDELRPGCPMDPGDGRMAAWAGSRGARRPPGRARRGYARAARDEHNDLPLYRAHMLLDQARVAAALGDRAQAERARQHATEIYDGLGATAYAERASAGLASACRGPPPTGCRRRWASPIASRTC